MSFVIVPWVPKKGYHVQFRREPVDGSFHHTYGGPLDQPDSMCPRCKTPFLRYLCLDTSDPRLELQSQAFARLPLCFCPECVYTSPDPFFYRVREDSSVEWIRHAQRDHDELSCPQTNLVESVWHLELEPIPDEVQVATAAILSGEFDPRVHESVLAQFDDEPNRVQIGGPPDGPQDPNKFNCPDCGSLMAFLATAVDDGPDAICVFGDCGCVLEFYYCTACAIVAGKLESD